ncbi:LysR family transcriptional regulator [Amycolatopsis acidicola]|uniref:LysR family transcriptional regulator n=1 Tax=Amycolatopsis acidicola TaxID=2596893 RepID=A0A5N0V190_9PSEU|nr:LysR substrate-binding domain-containing protein [Amycolatopsis acidicola]KAA9157777.1 LysR family transcriptional regulator [Amycolatopsis acidicola]
MDVHPRMLRYFLAVAGELHFRRAAQRLWITGPALSQQIRQLEQELGFPLFHRTSRTVTLTDQGRELIPLAQAVVDASDALSDWARERKQGKEPLRVGFMASGAGTLTQEILKAATDRLPHLDVKLVHLRWDEQTQALHDNRVDVAFAREPAETDGLRCTPVLSEKRVVMLPATHALATRTTLSFTEIADETFLPSATGSAEWTDYWLVNPRPDGSRARTGPPISTVEEMLEECAAGHGIVITAGSVPMFYAHPGVRFAEVEDLPPNHVLLCVREKAGTAATEFEDVVLDLIHRGAR